VTIDQLRKSYNAIKRNAAPGIDGVTWYQYGVDLERQLQLLHDRLHSGRYRAKPARRVTIPKADGSERLLSVWCLEDKIVQQALTNVLNAIYEADFLVFSYGFRPGRGQHDALDAHRFKVDLNKRLSKFGLNIHPDKTRLIQFGRYAQRDRLAQGNGKPETFDFLGFTFFCTVTRFDKRFMVGRKTIKKRIIASLREIKRQLRRRLHEPFSKTGEWLHRVLLGHLNYFAVTGNLRSVQCFFVRVRRMWLRSLRRRSQRNRMSWLRFSAICARFVPIIHVTHPYPDQRFDAIA